MAEIQLNLEQPMPESPPIVEAKIPKTIEAQQFVFESTPNSKAKTFCQIMRHPDAPISFNIQVLERVKRWGLLAEDIDPSTIVGNYQEFGRLLWQARTAAEQGSLKFLGGFNSDPWNFDGCVEGEYSAAELTDKFPTAVALQTALGEPVKFVFRAEPGQFYLKLVVREDGRRQVIRMVDTERTIEEINADAQRAPTIVPRFEAIELPDNKTALLIQWVEGHKPSSFAEKAICLTQAEELLGVPIDIYDLWAGNFLISEEVDSATNEPRVFYIDRDIPETIAQKGYGEVSDERKKIFQQGKEKMT